jgi:Spondin_N
MSMITLLLIAAIVASSVADIVFENEVVKISEIFDLDYARQSDVSVYQTENSTKYYCVFRSNWNPENHPAQYPELARWGNPLMFSHTNEYAPFIRKRAAQRGVEQIAEVSWKALWNGYMKTSNLRQPSFLLD